MKKFLIGLLACASIALSGCASNEQFNNVTYESFGVVNDSAKRAPNVVYEISAGSVIFAILFCETMIIPVYIVGWDLYQPVRLQ
jgi:hypothetical protein